MRFGGKISFQKIDLQINCKQARGGGAADALASAGTLVSKS